MAEYINDIGEYDKDALLSGSLGVQYNRDPAAMILWFSGTGIASTGWELPNSEWVMYEVYDPDSHVNDLGGVNVRGLSEFVEDVGIILDDIAAWYTAYLQFTNFSTFKIKATHYKGGNAADVYVADESTAFVLDVASDDFTIYETEWILEDELFADKVQVGGGTSDTFVQRISVAVNDCEERDSDSTVGLTSSDIELNNDIASGNQHCGFRYVSVPIPKDATIDSAFMQFVAKETSLEQLSMEIFAQNIGDAPEFTTAVGNLTTRTFFGTTVLWEDIPEWDNAGDETDDEKTVDIAALIQQVVNHPDWVSGNALVLMFDGVDEENYNRRNTKSFSGAGASESAQLTVNYTY